MSLPVATVTILNGLVAWLSCQKQLREFPSEVASDGMGRPLLANRGSALTRVGPKSETMTSIFGSRRDQLDPFGRLHVERR